ncbi:FUSC family protein [Micromonospora sp. NBC_01813]|uniref:FUSC family protein n=1 Tax=Micromonospora sp. NBC_01813 TaxID=2975988 RepID=UPI002DDAAE39|nr:FUSC family protein [Micromonospora sp. NBC_01813]WSA11423.1 FUSC family protein [Micromonospora sp. NBC_01813]
MAAARKNAASEENAAVEEKQSRLAATVDRVRRGVRDLPARGLREGRQRVRHLRGRSIIPVQAGVAAALAWLLADDVLRNPDPVFAPAVAVGTIVSALGQRLRRTIETVVGVAVGIAAGDLLVALLGAGPWQTGLIVALAVVVAILLRGGSTLLVQAGGTAVLIATLTPVNPEIGLPRFLNALIGGLVGLAVVLVLLPLNPLRLVQRAVGPALERLAALLDQSAAALASHDLDRARVALDQVRDFDPRLTQLQEALQAADEVVTLAPRRWSNRHVLAELTDGSDHIERAARNCRAMLRRVVSVLEDDEPVPDRLPTALGQLAAALRAMHRELDRGREFVDTRERVQRAVSEAGEAYAQGLGYSGNVVVAQVRTAGSDLLRATGIGRRDANRTVRWAAGRSRPPSPPPAPPRP